MNINNAEQPIFIQIAKYIEDNILNNTYPEETQIPSTTEFSLALKINPATVLKGMNLLVDSKVLYKQRGIGMFVAKGAQQILRNKRQADFRNTYIKQLVQEAKMLDINEETVIKLVKEVFEDEGD